MRDLIVLAIILGSIPACYFSPYFGVLMWTWVAYFNPHRFTWGMAYNFPVAAVIAAPTLLGLLIRGKPNRPFLVRETALLLLLWMWFGVTFLYAMHVPMFSDHVDAGRDVLMRVCKIFLMTFVTILLVNSRKRLYWLLLVIALSFGILAIKGTLFGIRTGGEFRVWGPPDSFVADNNDFGLAVCMTLPMMFFLARETTNRWLRLLLRLSFLCSIVTIVLTYSRGAMLGLAAVLTAIAIKSNRKAIGVVLLIICLVFVLSFAPSAWMTRMDTFLHGKLDSSAQGRLNAWQFAWALALHYPLTGGSFETFTPQLYERFTPQFSFAGPHSIYFQMLGEQGFVGLGIFLILLVSCFLTLRRVRRFARTVPALAWMIPYTHMLEAGLVGYVVSGAFLPRGYFDLYYQIVSATIILKILCHREIILNALPQATETVPIEIPTAAAMS